MRYLLLILTSTAIISCTSAGDGGYDETKGTTEVDRTDTLNRESPYSTPGSMENTSPAGSDVH
ncbi:hypothetical protein BH09BAC1_BH09BAC1_24270 [soil metagenome]